MKKQSVKQMRIIMFLKDKYVSNYINHKTQFLFSSHEL